MLSQRSLVSDSKVPVPSARIVVTTLLAIPVLLILVARWANMIRLPSGDQRGKQDSPSVVSCFSPVPSMLMTQRLAKGFAVLKLPKQKTMRWPSGEMLGNKLSKLLGGRFVIRTTPVPSGFIVK